MIRYCISILTLSLALSCTQEVEVPSYLHIEEVKLITEQGEGTDRQDFSDAWLFVNKQFIGAFNIPCTVPILQEGEVEVTINAGLKINNIASTRTMYSVLQSGETTDLNGESIETVLLERNKITSVKSEVRYRPNIVFEVLEDFENIGFSIEAIQGIDTTLGQDSIFTASISLSSENEAFEGNASGKITLTETQSSLLIVSDWIDLPFVGEFNYFEMHYKTDVVLNFGVFYNDPSGSKIFRSGLNPSEEWKKIVAQITPEEAQFEGTPIDQYKWYMEAELPAGVSTAEILIDNFKLIHGNEQGSSN